MMANRSPSDDAQRTAADKKRQQQAVDGAKAKAEYDAAIAAESAKTERLRALRLAKEEAERSTAEPVKPKPLKQKRQIRR